jgi:thiamine biosynthesis lipoprotein
LAIGGPTQIVENARLRRQNIASLIGPSRALVLISMKPLLTRTLVALSVVGGLLALRFTPVAAHADRGGVVSVQKTAMGTIWKIEAMDHGRPGEARRAIADAYAELERIEALMSEWRPQSPISQVDAAAGKHAVEVPAELRGLLERSIRYSEKTEGTFDITWRGMGNLWHFDDDFVPPTPAQVEAARRNIDYRSIKIEANFVYLPEGKNIGLGGIAKGYGVNRAVDVLIKAGFSDCLVDGGGDVKVSGTHDGQPWRLGNQDPRAEHGKLLGLVPLSGNALVTSGDYERFRIVDGVRYHHIIDPRTGWPATASTSVSVLSDDAEQGVVLAKAIFILGPQKGLDLARREGVDALLIDPFGHHYATPGFARNFDAQ